MAKRRRKPRRRRPKPVKPDEVTEFAGITMARYGRLVCMQSHRTPEQQRQLEARWVAKYPEVIRDINDRVVRIRRLVAMFDPLELLKQGFWAMSVAMIGKTTEADYSFEDGVAARMVDYVQAVIVSTAPAESRKQLTEDHWKGLHDEVKQLYELLGITFHIVNSARKKATEPDYDPDYDHFCVQAQMHATFVRAVRYPVHDFEFLQDFLGPHEDAFQRLFSISVVEFVRAIRQIQHSLCRQSVAAFEDLHEEYLRTLRLADELSGDYPHGMDLIAAMAMLREDPDWQQRRESIAGRIAGLDLFDLQKITSLPQMLLDELSLEPGQDKSFFASGDYAGWPVRVLPTKFRPFLKVHGKYYCFDPINIMDDLYRAMQRLICRTDPGYAETWNSRQKEASECRPVQLLEESLPGAKVFRSVTYPWQKDSGQKAKWCELDGLVLFDDAMFVVEVKAGAFTWTPPLTDFPSYLKSIEGLLKRPAEQAARFLDYLRHARTVTLYDDKHREIARLSGEDFRTVIPLCVTLDSLTTAAYQVRELASVGVSVPQPICCMAIDDLRVYRDILPSGVTFVHFMAKRHEAECDPLVYVNDELDHLGLYLAHVNYVRHARRLKDQLGSEVRSWPGYRRDIDHYFFELLDKPEAAECPCPRIGPRLSEIIACLDTEGLPQRCHCAAILLDMPEESKKDFEKALAKSLQRSLERGQQSPFHVQGESSITVFCDAPGISGLSASARQDYTLAWMTRANVSTRLMLSIRFDAQDRIEGVQWQYLRLEDISADQRARIAAKAAAQAERRVSAYVREHGEIGRNDPCPCGSGKKYKRCCGGRGSKGTVR